jgi:hypothetical protein
MIKNNTPTTTPAIPLAGSIFLCLPSSFIAIVVFVGCCGLDAEVEIWGCGPGVAAGVLWDCTLTGRISIDRNRVAGGVLVMGLAPTVGPSVSV